MASKRNKKNRNSKSVKVDGRVYTDPFAMMIMKPIAKQKNREKNQAAQDAKKNRSRFDGRGNIIRNPWANDIMDIAVSGGRVSPR